MSENKQSENTEKSDSNADSVKELKASKAECHDLLKHTELSKKQKSEFHKELDICENEKDVEVVMDKINKAEEALESQGDNTAETATTSTNTEAPTVLIEETVEEPEPVDAILTKLEDLENNPNWKRFLQIKFMTKTLTQDPRELNEAQKTALVSEFNTWLLAGSPNPEMAKVMGDAKALIIDKVYRFKHLGKEKLRWVTADGVMHGKNKKDEWNVPYSADKAKKLVEQAIATSLNPKFYIIGNQKYACKDPTNFNKSFDECCKMGLHGTL